MHESLLVNLMKQLANVIITILFEFQSITGQEDISESGAIQLLFDTLVITKMFKLVILNELEQQFTKLVEWLQMLVLYCFDFRLIPWISRLSSRK